MNGLKPLSRTTRQNWQINSGLFITALLVSLSGIYFLFLPDGYQGGRNPLYSITILFNRHTWDLIHTWTGVGMILAAALHIVIHWKWFVSMLTGNIWRSLTGKGTPMNRFGKFNVAVNIIIGLSFLLAAITGVYFLYFPQGRGGVADPMLLFSRTTWSAVHDWSGVVMILAAVTHFVIHWRWVVNVTRRYFPLSRNRMEPAPITANGSKPFVTE